MRAIVTGAASGIGSAIARMLAREPDTGLVLTDRDSQKLAVIAEELGRSTRVERIVGDIADEALPALLVDRCVERFGGVDAIISNAGAVSGAPLLELDIEQFDLLFRINTRPTWLLGKAAHAHLKASGGSIVATASMSAEHPTPPLGTYAASKAALLMLIRQMALEWGPDGIRANCVSPGPTVTGITAASYSDPERLDRRQAAIPLGKVSVADDIANAIQFLIGPGASQITGHNLVVDGGLGTALMALSGAGTGLDTMPAR
jgi:NAD(P)-dependent dehydrogenase (short-subunit alcohol dehydrogenase family)